MVNNKHHGLEGTPLGEYAKKSEREKELQDAPLITKLTPEELRKKRLEEK